MKGLASKKDAAPKKRAPSKKRKSERPPAGKYAAANDVARYSLLRNSTVVQDEIEHVKRVLSAWHLQMTRTRTLYRARDGKLWGLPHRIEGEMTPDRFIEFGMPTDHNPLGEIYPQGWQQLEDEQGGCNWLRNKEQELMTLKFLESLAEVPTVLGSWAHVKRVKP